MHAPLFMEEGLFLDQGVDQQLSGATLSPPPPSTSTPLQNSMMEELKASGLEDIARDSGLVNDQGDLMEPMVVQERWKKREEAEWSDNYQEESSASYTSPVKRGRAKARASQSSGKRGKARRSKVGAEPPDSKVAARGLRHFSLAVCNKVREKGVTSYSEVADELVLELDDDGSKHDEKNLRRRVYDALNVLSAMDIIRKVKKEIHWVGLPTSSSTEMRHLEDEIGSRDDRIAKKTRHLSELEAQVQLYTALIERNAKADAPNDSEKLTLPFIIISADNRSKIDLRVSSDRSEYVFDFTHPFVVKDDPEILMAILNQDEPAAPNDENNMNE